RAGGRRDAGTGDQALGQRDRVHICHVRRLQNFYGMDIHSVRPELVEGLFLFLVSRKDRASTGSARTVLEAKKMPKLDLDAIEQTNRTTYPMPFAAEMGGRHYRRLGPAG